MLPVRADIYREGKLWCARCLDMDVFAQGKTLEELVTNLEEAVKLHSARSRRPVDSGIKSAIIKKK